MQGRPGSIDGRLRRFAGFPAEHCCQRHPESVQPKEAKRRPRRPIAGERSRHPAARRKPQGFHRFSGWRGQLAREAVIAVLVASYAFGLTWSLENRLAANQEISENVRFIRERSDSPQSAKPFSGLLLHGASLSGLNLGCQSGESTCQVADLTEADMREATLVAANLQSARLALSDLRDADLGLASLQDAVLTAADLRGAILAGARLNRASLRLADLRGADLGGADLRGANLQSAQLSTEESTAPALVICYDQTTQWPDGFTPLNPPHCGSY